MKKQKILLLNGFGMDNKAFVENIRQNIIESQLQLDDFIINVFDYEKVYYAKNRLYSLNLNEGNDLEYLQTEFEELLNVDVVIGWSLGGQVALKLIEKGLLKPKKLILIATPYQFIQNEINPNIGLDKNIVKDFCDKLFLIDATFDSTFNANIQCSLTLIEMFAIGDSKASLVKESLKPCNYKLHLLIDHLDSLHKFSGDDIKFNCFKDIEEIHYVIGENDFIVQKEQAEYFRKALDQNVNVIYVANCGHAPQVSNFNVIKDLL